MAWICATASDGANANAAAVNSGRLAFIGSSSLFGCVPIIVLFWAGDAFAHGFGERYELPLPLTLFLTASGLVVLVSFAVMALFLRSGSDLRDYPRVHLLGTWFGPLIASATVILALRLVALFLFLLVIVACIFGEQRAFKNIAPVMVWAIAWVGFAYVAALAGNLWALVNPLDTLFRWTENLYAQTGRRLSLDLPYPSRLGVWPAVALFLGFVWMELVWEGADAPARLATALLVYSGLTWLGMLLFGRNKWLRRGEIFSVVYGYLARFAPLEARTVDGRREWNLRPYAVGLLPREPLGPSEIVLVILILAAVSYDGFLETPAWAAIVERFGYEHAPLKTAGLLGGLLLFLAAYLFVCGAIERLGSSGPSASRARTAGLFVLTLVPIAIAYHVAHYLSFFLMAGQYLVPLASDPLGQGWDLFGGARHFIRLSIIDARAVWYVSVAAIVAGHVVAVFLAHVVALREFSTRRAALRSQVPMVALMVAYTMTSLWIIAQPIVTPQR